jgi:hypothetical protein
MIERVPACGPRDICADWNSGCEEQAEFLSILLELEPFSFHASAVSCLRTDEGNVWQCVDTVEIGGLDTRVTGPLSHTPGRVPEHQSRRRHERILL